MKGRPSLPQWLQLVPSSRHSALSYLIGTPVTPLRQITVHVIAKSLENAEIKQQFIVINLGEDTKYNSATVQLLDIHLRNYDAETLIADRSGLIGKLEMAVKDTFIGKNVNPYIFSIRPDVYVPEGKQYVMKNNKVGSVVSLGTQRGFYSNINNIVHILKNKPSYCSKTHQVLLNKKFEKSFDIDWCQTQLHNITLIREFNERGYEKEILQDDLMKRTEKSNSLSAWSNRQRTTTTRLPDPGNLLFILDLALPQNVTTEGIPTVEPAYSIWDSVLVFPLIAVLCIVLVLILSAIFFGRREGQQWRDYKTPKDQLEEYISVRESQRHLRELSVQRQLLLMSRDRSNSIAPSGIHSFLQPKSGVNSVTASTNRLAQYNKKTSKLNGDEDTVELLPSGSEMIPVGKQTVAEAAKQCGSSLHLYRNPLDSGSDGEPEDNDSLEIEKHRSF